MQDLAIISDKINTLYQLSQKDIVLLDDLEPIFRPDLEEFLIGQTLTLYYGKPAIGHRLYQLWLHKLRIKGFDYAINFKQ